MRDVDKPDKLLCDIHNASDNVGSNENYTEDSFNTIAIIVWVNYCTRLTCLTLCNNTDFLRTPMLTILRIMHTAKPNHVRRQLSKSLSASKILIGGCRQTVWNWTEIRHSSSGLAPRQQLAKVQCSTIRIGDVNIRVSTEVTCLELFLTVKSSLRHMWGDLLAGVSTICDSCERYAVRWPLTLQKNW